MFKRARNDAVNEAFKTYFDRIDASLGHLLHNKILNNLKYPMNPYPHSIRIFIYWTDYRAKGHIVLRNLQAMERYV